MKSVPPPQYNLVREGQRLYYFDEDTGEIASGTVEQKKQTFSVFFHRNAPPAPAFPPSSSSVLEKSVNAIMIPSRISAIMDPPCQL